MRHMMMIPLLLVAVSVLALTLPVEAEGDPVREDPCVLACSAECGVLKVLFTKCLRECVQGRCGWAPECKSHADCPKRWRCKDPKDEDCAGCFVPGRCEKGSCLPAGDCE